MADEFVELQNPYSDVSLFLSRKIKEQMDSTEQKWSLSLQKRLLKAIGPEFQKQFPHYRLRAVSLKRAWEKVLHFAQLFEKQKQALTPDGKLDLYFLVRENLKTAFSQYKPLHPFLLANQLAFKVGQSMATFDGTCPKLQALSHLIWGAQQHITSPFPQTHSPDSQDVLLTRWMFDCLSKKPGLSQADLQAAVQKKIDIASSFNEKAPWMEWLCMQWSASLLPLTSFVQTTSALGQIRLKLWIHPN